MLERSYEGRFLRANGKKLVITGKSRIRRLTGDLYGELNPGLTGVQFRGHPEEQG